MRNLLYLLLALPLVFAACEPDNPDADKPAVKDPVLTLTSNATLEFTAEGGAGEITYTLENAKEGVSVTAECAAEWVADVVVAEKVTFTVAANEGEARETKVVVKYDTQKFEVAVKQAATDAPEKVKFEASNLYGYYVSGADLELDADNYYVVLSDKGFDEDDEPIAGGKYYVVNLYAAAYEGEWSETMVVPVGEYTMASTNKSGTFSDNFSYYIEIGDDGDFEPVYYEAGKLVVTETGVTLTVTIDGVEHVVTYTGECVVENASDNPSESFYLELTMKEAAFLLNDGLAADECLVAFTSETVGAELLVHFAKAKGNAELTAGTYTMAAGDIGDEYSVFGCEYPEYMCQFSDAVVTVGVNGEVYYFDMVLTSTDGYRLHIVYEGEMQVLDNTTPEIGYDVEFNADFFGGTYYNTGDYNFYIVLSDIEVTGTPADGGTYYYFDLYTTKPNENLTVPNGVYTFDSSNSCAVGTFGAEYSYAFTKVDGNITWYLPVSGTVTVTDGKIVADLVMEDGSTHIVTYEGDISLGNTGGGGGDDAYIQADADCSFSNAYTYVNYYGQWYNDATDDYVLEILEDANTVSGKYLVLEVLADYATAVDHSGKFTINETYGVNTALPGFIEDGYFFGCWYIDNLTDGAITGKMARLVSGTIDISIDADGVETYVLDCVDENGFKVTGTVTTGSATRALTAKKHDRGNLVPAKRAALSF